MISIKSSGIYDLTDLDKCAYNEDTITIKIKIYHTEDFHVILSHA